MPLPAILPLIGRLAYALGGLEYLRRTLQPPSSATVGVANPYNPPFTGGQCTGVRYYINVSVTQPRLNRTATTFNDYQFSAFGAITNIQIAFNAGGSPSVFFTGKDSVGSPFNGSSAIPNLFSNEAFVVNSITLVRADGSTVECGNVGNPTPPPSIADDGIGDSGSPNLDNSDNIVEGSPLVAIPNFLPALLAALAAARSAASALAGISALADAIASIADLLKSLKDALDKAKEKDAEENKELTRYNFGSIARDGYLRLYPSTTVSKKKAVYLDLQALSIPLGYGKYFGSKSPNFYRFRSIGHIAFTSPTFGVMEVIEIEFTRTSIPIPENATGFYYHFGLDGAIVANCSAYYVELKPTQST